MTATKCTPIRRRPEREKQIYKMVCKKILEANKKEMLECTIQMKLPAMVVAQIRRLGLWVWEKRSRRTGMMETTISWFLLVEWID